MPRKKKQIKPYSHFTEEERISIQMMLQNRNKPFSIAKALNKSPSSVSREINRHTVVTAARNNCAHFAYCNRKKVCGLKYCNRLCRGCSTRNCTKTCKDYTVLTCEAVSSSPYLCNGCNNLSVCGLEHRIYKARDAQKEYVAMLHDKRVGFDLTEEEIKTIDQLIAPLIKSGYSPYAITQVLGDKLPCSESTLYRLIDQSAIGTRNVDLREKVKRKPRKHRRITNKDALAVISEAKKGRLWGDYLRYKRENNVVAVQLDCVEGKQSDDAVIMSLHWPVEHMQLYFILNFHNAANVVRQFDIIEEAIGLELFREMFPVILTDNGHEFTDIHGMERSCTVSGEKRTIVFFCEPNKSYEKGNCERNHRLLRNIIPKGTSLQQLTQQDMTLVTNHVNSYIRRTLGGICPYDAAIETYDEDFFILLGLERIAYEEVNLTPNLLK